MTDNNGIRSGSLQFYPRVRAKKIIPGVNWKPLDKSSKDDPAGPDGVGFMGFVGYKVGMVSVWAKDSTVDSMTKGKKIIVPATLIECPAMKIYSVRFYKNGKVASDVVVSNDKILKKSLKVGKIIGKIDDSIEFDDVRVIMYSGVGKTGIGKKKVDMVEVGVSGDKDSKLAFIKENIGKEISVSDVFSEGLVDVRGVTKGYGTNGPMKRFGIALKSHKSEKGQRRPGNIAPWHPARTTFRSPQAGQTGYHSRVCYNNLILESGKLTDRDATQAIGGRWQVAGGNQRRDVNKAGGYKQYGVLKNDYLILRGSIPGPAKRGIFVTQALRPTNYQAKKKFEVLELR